MDKQVEFVGGPVDGRKGPAAGMDNIIAVPVDSNFKNIPRGKPFAFALYQCQTDDSGVEYRFIRFERPNKQPFEAEFVDGPYQGTHLCSQPADYCTEDVLVPLAAVGATFTGVGEPVAVAIYRSRYADGKWKHFLDRVEESGENVEKVRTQVAEHRALQAVNRFYESPDYSIYTKPPTGEHPQISIQHGHRKASVDEKMAPLIQSIWRRGLETLGSCQERNPGEAYVLFPLARQGRLFHGKLAEACIESKCETKPFRIGNTDSDEKIELDSAFVTFSPDDIPAIVQLLGV